MLTLPSFGILKLDEIRPRARHRKQRFVGDKVPASLLGSASCDFRVETSGEVGKATLRPPYTFEAAAPLATSINLRRRLYSFCVMLHCKSDLGALPGAPHKCAAKAPISSRLGVLGASIRTVETMLS